ncbi:MAG: hypothetical protein JWQ09_2805 [Segetibacter sp.]|nr:hypothetical protein [Segetibacter sp.]
MQKIRVLHYIEHLTLGGQQLYTLKLLHGVNRKDFAFQVGYVVPGPLLEAYSAFSEKTHLLGSGTCDARVMKKQPIQLILNIWKLFRLLKKEGIDIIITNGSYTHFTGVIASALARKKVVRVVGGDLNKNEPFSFTKNFKRIPLYKGTHKYIAYKYMLDAHAEKGVPEHKLARDIPVHVVDTNQFYPVEKQERVSLRNKLGIAKEDYCIGWLGRISKEMEIPYTVEMVKDLVQRGVKNIKLLIVGDGPTMKEFKQSIILQGLEEYTIFTGFVPHEKAPLYFSAMDVVPLLDIDPHGGGMIREAMSCGRVIITVNGKSGVQAEWVEHLKNGILVQPENFVTEAATWCEKLMTDKKLENDISEGARKYAIEKMDFSIMSKEFTLTLKELGTH